MDSFKEKFNSVRGDGIRNQVVHGHLNQSAVSRLGAAGVSVPGFGISPSSPSGPSTVSFQDARSAASTANNFRQRHGDQVASAARTANSFNQKYGISDRVQGTALSAARTPEPETETPIPVASAAKKKPPLLLLPRSASAPVPFLRPQATLRHHYP
ncbi:unnamed protein product [Parascedosporium putredinis]|uniref:Uncharacterized protein n=1 Tax=Parascedosporium putredinis TaxID=1442378 RepID=A0A9P1H8B9_9PEZI|nr:unnamed protein product [Parascedosporium putredinis]CAI8000647.1 unnamed protein product [Parascedosporium putredinis]